MHEIIQQIPVESVVATLFLPWLFPEGATPILQACPLHLDLLSYA